LTAYKEFNLAFHCSGLEFRRKEPVAVNWIFIVEFAEASLNSHDYFRLAITWLGCSAYRRQERGQAHAVPPASDSTSVRFEAFTAVTRKNVFLDIGTSSYFTGVTLRLHYRAQPVNAM
jgi:hypothetical protein